MAWSSSDSNGKPRHKTNICILTIPNESYIMIMSHDNPKIQINYIDVAKPVIIALVPV